MAFPRSPLPPQPLSTPSPHLSTLPNPLASPSTAPLTGHPHPPHPPAWYLFQFHRVLQYARPSPGSRQPFFWMFVDNLVLSQDDRRVATRFLEVRATVREGVRPGQGGLPGDSRAHGPTRSLPFSGLRRAHCSPEAQTPLWPCGASRSPWFLHFLPRMPAWGSRPCPETPP